MFRKDPNLDYEIMSDEEWEEEPEGEDIINNDADDDEGGMDEEEEEDGSFMVAGAVMLPLLQRIVGLRASARWQVHEGAARESYAHLYISPTMMHYSSQYLTVRYLSSVFRIRVHTMSIPVSYTHLTLQTKA